MSLNIKNEATHDLVRRNHASRTFMPRIGIALTIEIDQLEFTLAGARHRKIPGWSDDARHGVMFDHAPVCVLSLTRIRWCTNMTASRRALDLVPEGGPASPVSRDRRVRDRSRG
ncbi:hypothetical protein [Microbacterium halophytorum]|uniref:hypothetical protein n=1 Tax=Microbacterium halophytorum TaxID=2067568 RepID=UPI00131A13C3|nr:hypothetical protein [Microbacterium halophytorum]